MHLPCDASGHYEPGARCLRYGCPRWPLKHFFSLSDLDRLTSAPRRPEDRSSANRINVQCLFVYAVVPFYVRYRYGKSPNHCHDSDARYRRSEVQLRAYRPRIGARRRRRRPPMPGNRYS
ncbi:hypothetical protein EVAR_55883_1 [Eumeta japonica]|uniref:Uncharacterized protein n=1 Tax=Eumeta variegata TaxID=151549 RepID=A0A4C1YM37_EUMVA|nr:hypothetical protein EVAR_55883_1 [Eumeta japonica]